MSAEVESMMYAGEVPWHGFGTYVGDEAVGSAQALVAAGLDWQVEKGILKGGPRMLPLEGMHCLYREADGQPLGYCGTGYQPIQNEDGFAIMDSLGVKKYHTAGSLYNGWRVWMLAELESDMVIRVDGKEDHYKRFLLGTNTHGAHSGRNNETFRIYETDVRVVCANTFSWAVSANLPLVSIAHRGNVAAQMEEASKLLKVIDAKHLRYEEWLKALADEKLDADAIKRFEQAVFAIDLSDIEASISQRRKAYETFEQILSEEVAQVGNTAYAMAQAISGFADHGITIRGRGPKDAEGHRTLDGSERFVSMLDGNGAKFKEKAYGVLGSMTGLKLGA